MQACMYMYVWAKVDTLLIHYGKYIGHVCMHNGDNVDVALCFGYKQKVDANG